MIVRVRPRSKPPTRGDFAARIDGGALTLPAIFGEFLKKSEVESAEDFITVVDTYPKQVAASLGWAESDVVSALRELATKLSRELGVDFVADLNAERTSYPMGARTVSGTRPTSSTPPSEGHKLG